MVGLPSGKRLHSYEKSKCSMGKSTIIKWSFPIAMLNNQMVYPHDIPIMWSFKCHIILNQRLLFLLLR